jgi:hypothetical protein
MRAVVHLGALAPADVRVTARIAAGRSTPVPVEPLRLWSVQSYHNGAVVFEAPTETRMPDDATDFLVTVAPARARPGGTTLASIVRRIAPSERAGCATCGDSSSGGATMDPQPYDSRRR